MTVFRRISKKSNLLAIKKVHKAHHCIVVHNTVWRFQTFSDFQILREIKNHYFDSLRDYFLDFCLKWLSGRKIQRFPHCVLLHEGLLLNEAIFFAKIFANFSEKRKKLNIFPAFQMAFIIMETEIAKINI